jgi:hypothetical protein
MKSAVLFLVFNRPDTTKKVFEAIRKAQPPRLYVAADGPRTDKVGEHEKCEEVRQIATAVDWDCKLKTLFRENNLGCKVGESSGIDWFFEQEEEGIVLEDDVLPIRSFFPYCDELLERYRHDARVGVISGCNLVSKRFTPKESYFFSRHNHVWGWASWRRAWQYYDVTMKAWSEWRDKGGLHSISDGNKLFESYWTDILDKTFYGGINTWDYQWCFTCWYHGMVTVLPAQNQTYNIGFARPDAVHTTGNVPDYIKKSKPELLVFPLSHPVDVDRSVDADALIDHYVFKVNKKVFIQRKIRQMPFLGDLLSKIKQSILKVI